MKGLRYLTLALSSLIIIGLFGSQIKSLERLKSDGRTVFLELRPVDPRALMMGDYMALQYDQDRGSIPNTILESQIGSEGTLIFKDVNGVAVLQRVGSDPVGDQEYKLKYVLKGGDVNIGSPRFYFQNGTAQDYEQAKYGVFKVDKSGSAVLINLADKNKEIIRPKL